MSDRSSAKRFKWSRPGDEAQPSSAGPPLRAGVQGTTTQAYQVRAPNLRGADGSHTGATHAKLQSNKWVKSSLTAQSQSTLNTAPNAQANHAASTPAAQQRLPVQKGHPITKQQHALLHAGPPVSKPPQLASRPRGHPNKWVNNATSGQQPAASSSSKPPLTCQGENNQALGSAAAVGIKRVLPEGGHDQRAAERRVTTPRKDAAMDDQRAAERRVTAHRKDAASSVSASKPSVVATAASLGSGARLPGTAEVAGVGAGRAGAAGAGAAGAAAEAAAAAGVGASRVGAAGAASNCTTAVEVPSDAVMPVGSAAQPPQLPVDTTKSVASAIQKGHATIVWSPPSRDSTHSKQAASSTSAPAPLPVGEEAPAYVGEEVPANVGEEAPAYVGEEAPANVGEEAPANVGEEAPANASQMAEAGRTRQRRRRTAMGVPTILTSFCHEEPSSWMCMDQPYGGHEAQPIHRTRVRVPISIAPRVKSKPVHGCCPLAAAKQANRITALRSTQTRKGSSIPASTIHATPPHATHTHRTSLGATTTGLQRPQPPVGSTSQKPQAFRWVAPSVQSGKTSQAALPQTASLGGGKHQLGSTIAVGGIRTAANTATAAANTAAPSQQLRPHALQATKPHTGLSITVPKSRASYRWSAAAAVKPAVLKAKSPRSISLRRPSSVRGDLTGTTVVGAGSAVHPTLAVSTQAAPAAAATPLEGKRAFLWVAKPLKSPRLAAPSALATRPSISASAIVAKARSFRWVANSSTSPRGSPRGLMRQSSLTAASSIVTKARLRWVASTGPGTRPVAPLSSHTALSHGRGPWYRWQYAHSHPISASHRHPTSMKCPSSISTRRMGASKTAKLVRMNGQLYRILPGKRGAGSHKLQSINYVSSHLSHSATLSRTSGSTWLSASAKAAAQRRLLEPRRSFLLASPRQSIASSALFRSLSRVRARQAAARAVKKRGYCPQYCRTGVCKPRKVQKGGCPFTHDPSKVAVCIQWLQGTCNKEKCPLQHKLCPELMPVCTFFLKGVCSNEDCPYLHVNYSSDAPVCRAFVRGYCPLGSQCPKQHVFLRKPKVDKKPSNQFVAGTQSAV